MDHAPVGALVEKRMAVFVGDHGFRLVGGGADVSQDRVALKRGDQSAGIVVEEGGHVGR